MNKRAVTTGPVFLVLSAEVAQTLQTQQKDFPHLPDPTRIEADISILNDEGGVPAVVATKEQDSEGPTGEDQPSPLPYTHTLFLYTPSYALELCETQARNGYRITHIEPTNLQMYDRLAQGALSLSAARWRLCPQEKEIPNSQSSHWQLLEQEWQILQKQVQQLREYGRGDPPFGGHSGSASPVASPTTHAAASPAIPAALPAHHERFLDLAVALIRPTPSLEDSMDDQPRNENSITAQQAAISLLREGKASNPYLLSVLVDHRYQPYEVTTESVQIEALNQEQEEIVRKGLSVPDLLLIHATSDTERTRAAGALAALIKASSTKQQRVLLVAHSQQALQDLLALLPEELAIMYIQHGDQSGDTTTARSVQAQARHMQQQLLARTEEALPHLTRLAVSRNTIDLWVERLQRHLVTLSNNEALEQLSTLRRRMVEIEQFVSAPFRPMLAEAATAVQQLEESLAHQKQRMSAVTERHAAAEELRQKPAIGRLFNSVEQLGQSWLKRQQAQLESLQAEYEARKLAYQQAQETMQQVIREDLEYAWCQQRIQQIEAEHATALAEATKAASILQETLRELVPEQPPLAPPEMEQSTISPDEAPTAPLPYPGSTVEAMAAPLPYTPGNELMLQYYLSWYTVTRALLEQRHALLQEWRNSLSGHVEVLYPELLRYADVVCGTSSSIAATKELEQIGFDLVIIDDAARLTLPDLLLSLVRARRAILVGDPQQEPPFDKQAVQSLLQTQSSQEPADDEQQITAYLSRSVFAQLWSSLDDAASSLHAVRLTTHDNSQSPVQTADMIELSEPSEPSELSELSKEGAK